MTTLMKRNGEGFSNLPLLFNDPFLRNWFNWTDESETGTLPAVNIKETPEYYELAVAAPGMNKNDFKIEVDHNRLIISGENKNQHEVKQGSTWLRREFNYQSFVRSFTLTEKQVSAENIQAKYVDGVLYINIPKTDEAKSKAVKVIPVG